ncbi:MAG: response regulator transcription factor [Clostridia bacterium]|nr:response regulator transcription factor [Clostridia bacterium]
MDKIRIVIVEDDPGWLKAMVNFLNHEEDMIIVGTATNRKDAVSLASSLEVDIFLMDINLNENKCEGIYAAAEILQISPQVKIIMLTSLVEESILADAFAVGASNYISKENHDEIPKVIRGTFSNRFSPIEILGKKYANLKREEQLVSLTPSEREVFDLIEQGFTQPQIQDKLVKTKNTLKSQIKGILSKFGVRNTKEAVKKVRSGGILPTHKEKRSTR